MVLVELVGRHHGADGGDDEAIVRLEDVEMLHAVAEMVVVLADAQAERLGDEAERRAVLAAALERAKAQLGVGLGDGES